MRVSYYGRLFFVGFGIGAVLYVTFMLNSLASVSYSKQAMQRPFVQKANYTLNENPLDNIVAQSSEEDSPDRQLLLSIAKEMMTPLKQYLMQHIDSVVEKLEHRLPAYTSGERRAWTPTLPTIYIITPTYRRPEQLPELVRMGQTLMHIPNIVWLVVEDGINRTKEVTTFLKSTNLHFEHLLGPHPVNRSIAKGVSNRNEGMKWIREHATDGVFYMADDDNSYSLKVFEEMRYTKKVSIWPVGLLTSFGVSTPIVRNNKVVGWYDGYIVNRKFPVDMACFAVSVSFFLQHPKASMPYSPGYEETGFLRSMNVEWDDLEPKADNCTKIYVWHTRTVKNGLAKKVDYNKFKANNSNIEEIEKQLI